MTARWPLFPHVLQFRPLTNMPHWFGSWPVLPQDMHWRLLFGLNFCKLDLLWLAKVAIGSSVCCLLMAFVDNIVES